MDHRTKWQKDHHIKIVNEHPFRFYWDSQEEKEAFYQKHLDRDDFAVYKIVYFFAFTDSLSEKDLFPYSAMDVRFVEILHPRIMEFMEERDVSRYHSLRLQEVTGLFLTEEKEYTTEFAFEITNFLSDEKDKLKEKVEHIINEHLQKPYQKRVKGE